MTTMSKYIKIGLALVLAIGLAAVSATWFMRRRASGAERAISETKIKDADERAEQAPERERLREIESELHSPPASAPVRTYDAVLEEQRRRGQVIE